MTGSLWSTPRVPSERASDERAFAIRGPTATAVPAVRASYPAAGLPAAGRATARTPAEVRPPATAPGTTPPNVASAIAPAATIAPSRLRADEAPNDM